MQNGSGIRGGRCTADPLDWVTIMGSIQADRSSSTHNLQDSSILDNTAQRRCALWSRRRFASFRPTNRHHRFLGPQPFYNIAFSRGCCAN